jgi:hypothetical protein
VLLPDKSVLLAVGDVAGHGIGAVTGMMALRNQLRGLAATGASPAQLLTWLNTASFYPAEVMATVICAIYNPTARTLRWARAGHLPPLVVRDGIARTEPLPGGILLGVNPDASYQEAVIRLRLGGAVVLFTDGLIERRDCTIDGAARTPDGWPAGLSPTSASSPASRWPARCLTPVMTRAWSSSASGNRRGLSGRDRPAPWQHRQADRVSRGTAGKGHGGWQGQAASRSLQRGQRTEWQPGLSGL